MNIANCDGDFTCQAWEEIENLIIESSQHPFADIWLSGKTEYPCLAILVNGEYACVHYFLNDQGEMWQAVGDGEKDVVFLSGGERSEMPADAVVSLERALECTKQFYETEERPDCIEWREL